jgi:PKD repeat protein
MEVSVGNNSDDEVGKTKQWSFNDGVDWDHERAELARNHFFVDSDNEKLSQSTNVNEIEKSVFIYQVFFFVF